VLENTSIRKQGELQEGFCCCLPGRTRLVLKNRAAAEGCRECALVSDGGAEIRKRLALFFHRPSETIKTAEAFQFLRVIEARSIKRPA
jgi:hypothetical protein